MRESFIIIISLVICMPARCSDVGRDGFNFYKDYLRARYDENMEDYPEIEDRVLYFYRTPLPMYPRVLPVLSQEHMKRTENIFKHHMINKDLIITKPRSKRTSKAGLSLLMQNKQGPYPTLMKNRIIFENLYDSNQNETHLTWTQDITVPTANKKDSIW